MNLFSSIIYAQTNNTNIVDGIPTLKGLENVFESVISLAIPLAAIVLFVFLIIGGFKYLTAGSNAGKVEAAQKTITYAILGMVLIALAYLILELIIKITGASYLRQFTIRI